MVLICPHPWGHSFFHLALLIARVPRLSETHEEGQMEFRLRVANRTWGLSRWWFFQRLTAWMGRALDGHRYEMMGRERVGDILQGDARDTVL